MRRATIQEYNKLADKLSNLVGVMNFQFMELCVKAEPVALLNVRPLVEGAPTPLEECSKVTQPDDYSFILVPDYDEDLPAIAQAVMQVHPEFKVEGERETVDLEDQDGNPIQQEMKYLKVTMPEVNKDRRDVLKQGVDTIYDATKAQMEAANSLSKQKFAALAFTEEKGELDKLNDDLKALNKQWNEQRDKLHAAKLKEIEDAYNKWLTDKQNKEKSKQEADNAHDSHKALSMNIPGMKG